MAATDLTSLNIASTGEPSTDRLWDEYCLVQEKIDKIGEYKFKVKGWSATLLGAVLFGGIATSRIITALFCALVVAGVFHISEARQRHLSGKLQDRARALERAFRLLRPARLRKKWSLIERRIPEMEFVPGVAFALSDNFQQGRASSFVRKWCSWLILKSNDVFYCAQYALLCVLLAVEFCSFVAKTFLPSDAKPQYEISLGSYRIKVYKQAE